MRKPQSLSAIFSQVDFFPRRSVWVSGRTNLSKKGSIVESKIFSGRFCVGREDGRNMNLMPVNSNSL